MGFFREFLKLTRFEHALMLAIAVLIAEIVVLGAFPPITAVIALSLLVPIMSEMGSFALNDYLDMEADRLNKMIGRPLVKGTISPMFALWFSIFALTASTLAAYFINWPVFLIALVFNILAILYNWRLKDLPLVGNAYIGLTMAIPFVFGNIVVAQGLSITALVLALLGFLSGLAREIVKSAEDMEGDMKARRSRTLPVIVGERWALTTASLLYLLFIPLTAVPFMVGLQLTLIPALLVLAADAGILHIAVSLLMMRHEKRRLIFSRARKWSLACLFLGLMGLLLASLL